jgi:diguanylate cyclase (GGDEF)-like protein
MHRTLARLLRFALGASLLTVIALAAALFGRIQQQDAARHWVEHTHQVIDQLREVRIQSLLAGTSMRNYLILPLEDYLSSTREAAGEAVLATERLRDLTVDNADQQLATEKAVSEMREVMGGIMAAGNIAARTGVDAGRAHVATKVLADNTHELELVLNQIESKERDLLSARLATQQAQASGLKHLFVVIVLAFITFSVCAFVYCRRLLRQDLLRTAQLRKDAHVDPLTGLMNRRALATELEKMFASSNAAHRAFMVFDLNGFKPINDLHGHAAGDEVLRQVGDRLRRQCRQGDLIARLGGDEFLMVVNQSCSRSMAEAMASRLADHLLEPMVIGDETLSVGVAVGVALAGEDGTDMVSLLERADARMYAAKRAMQSAVQAPWRRSDAGLSPRWRRTSQTPDAGSGTGLSSRSDALN